MPSKMELQQPPIVFGAPYRAPSPVRLKDEPVIARGTPRPLPLVSRRGAVHALSANGSTPANDESGERGGPERVYIGF